MKSLNAIMEKGILFMIRQYKPTELDTMQNLTIYSFTGAANSMVVLLMGNYSNSPK